jgi:hypothetical protein
VKCFDQRQRLAIAVIGQPLRRSHARFELLETQEALAESRVDPAERGNRDRSRQPFTNRGAHIRDVHVGCALAEKSLHVRAHTAAGSLTFDQERRKYVEVCAEAVVIIPLESREPMSGPQIDETTRLRPIERACIVRDEIGFVGDGGSGFRIGARRHSGSAC